MAGEFEELYTSAFGRLVGQLFLVTAVGKIVSAWRPGTSADRQAATTDSRGRLP